MCESKANGGQRCYSNSYTRLAAAAEKWRAAVRADTEAEAAYLEHEATKADDDDDRSLYNAHRDASAAVQAAHAEVTKRRIEMASTTRGEKELRALHVPPRDEAKRQEVINEGLALRDRNRLVKLGVDRDEADGLSAAEARTRRIELEAAPAKDTATSQEDRQARQARMHEYVDSHARDHVPDGQEPQNRKARTLQEGDVLSQGFVVTGTEYSPTPRKVHVVGSYPPKPGRERQVYRREWGKDTKVRVQYNAVKALEQATEQPQVNRAAPVADPGRFSQSADVNQVIDRFDAEVSTENLTDDGELSSANVNARYKQIVMERDARLTALGNDLPERAGLSPAERAVVHDRGWDDESIRSTIAGQETETARVDALFFRASNERWATLAAAR